MGGMPDMELQKLCSYTRRAVDDYQLIADGDHIAVGISGGKDSLTLLYALAGLRRFYPKKFSLSALTVDLGHDGIRYSEVKKLCETLQVPFYVIDTQIANIVFEERNESSPCALCAKLRKGALNDRAKQLGCNKVAYAHHMDDVIETAFLSMLFEGRFYVFPPYTKLDQTDISVIRPLIYVSEAEVKGFQHKYQLPVIENPCPADGHTQREYVKQLLRQMNLDHPGVKKRLFHAVLSGTIPGWQKSASKSPRNKQK